jgi:hypothetical protein
VKVILRSVDLSFVQSAQIALEAEGIPAVISNESATGLPSSPSTLTLVDDQDSDRALVVLGGLQRTSRKPWWEASWAPRAILLLFVFLVLALFGLLIF